MQRPQLEQLRQVAVDQIVGRLPSLVQGALAPILRPIVDRITARLESLMSSQSSGAGTVIFHMPAPTPEPGATPAPTTPARAVMVRIDRPARVPLLAGTSLELYSCNGPYGPWSGVVRMGGIAAGDGFEVPFQDFPIAFRFAGASGLQSTAAGFAGTVHTNVEQLDFPVEVSLVVKVDGRTMAIDGMASATLAIGAQFSDAFGGGNLAALPIVPGPAGTCP